VRLTSRQCAKPFSISSAGHKPCLPPHTVNNREYDLLWLRRDFVGEGSHTEGRNPSNYTGSNSEDDNNKDDRIENEEDGDAGIKKA